ncbi:MAG: hypothetical protein QM758_29725 [Armatimonas sp.]
MIGLLLPALAAVLASVLWFKKPDDYLFNYRAGFFACLISAFTVTWIGRRGWYRHAILRGLTAAGCGWLIVLPFMAGDCVS